MCNHENVSDELLDRCLKELDENGAIDMDNVIMNENTQTLSTDDNPFMFENEFYTCYLNYLGLHIYRLKNKDDEPCRENHIFCDILQNRRNYDCFFKDGKTIFFKREFLNKYDRNDEFRQFLIWYIQNMKEELESREETE